MISLMLYPMAILGYFVGHLMDKLDEKNLSLFMNEE